jgi:predicted porin
VNSGTILNSGSVNTTGSTPSFNAFRVFDRNVFGGVSTVRFGALTAGRQATAVTESLWATDPLKANAGAINMNVRLGYLAAPGKAIQSAFGPNASLNVSGNALDRQDNTLKYAYRNGAGFVGVGTYSFGGVTGDAGNSSSSSAMLGWDHPLVSVRAAGAQFGDSDGTGFYAWTTGATGKLGPVKLKATYSGNKIDSADPLYGNLRTNVWAAGATYSATPKLDLTLAYYGARRTADGVARQEANKFVLVPEYYLTKSFWLYGIANYERFNGTGSALSNGTPLAAGTEDSLYLAVGLSFSFSS